MYTYLESIPQTVRLIVVDAELNMPVIVQSGNTAVLGIRQSLGTTNRVGNSINIVLDRSNIAVDQTHQDLFGTKPGGTSGKRLRVAGGTLAEEMGHAFLLSIPYPTEFTSIQAIEAVRAQHEDSASWLARTVNNAQNQCTE